MIGITPRAYFSAVAFWATVTLATALGARILWNHFWFLGEYFWQAAIGLGVLLAAAGQILAWKAWKSRPRSQRATAAALPPLMLVAIVAATPLLRSLGDDLQARWRFRSRLPEYERVVAATTAGSPDTAAPEAGHDDFVVDSGPPVRIAFVQPGGILDNWDGVVYDPSGRVGTATGWVESQGLRTLSAPADVRALFGGEIVQCTLLRTSWYRCAFT